MMRRSFLAFGMVIMTFGTANAQTTSSDPSSFCGDGTKKSAMFNDGYGFSNVAIREGDYVKVYREVASPDLDWVVYDGYVFSSENGSKLLFSRAVIYAGNPIVYVLTEDSAGNIRDNMMALPDGFHVPSEPSLASLEDFCRLPVEAGAQDKETAPKGP